MIVTINPADRRRAAKSLAITDVRLHISGQIIHARQFIERLSYGLIKAVITAFTKVYGAIFTSIVPLTEGTQPSDDGQG